MEYSRVLDNILGQKTKVKILRYLATHPDQESGRRIAQETGINHWQCHKVLRDLYNRGILKMRHAGNTNLFSLRKNHYIIEEAIMPLFNTEARLVETLIKELEQLKYSMPYGKNECISTIVLFGSIAKNQEKTHSDIDVLVIIKNKEDREGINTEIMKRNENFLSRYGNSLSPYIVTEDEFRKRSKKGDKLIKNIIKDGKVIFGKTMGEIIIK